MILLDARVTVVIQGAFAQQMGNDHILFTSKHSTNVSKEKLTKIIQLFFSCNKSYDTAAVVPTATAGGLRAVSTATVTFAVILSYIFLQ